MLSNYNGVIAIEHISKYVLYLILMFIIRFQHKLFSNEFNFYIQQSNKNWIEFMIVHNESL